MLILTVSALGQRNSPVLCHTNHILWGLKLYLSLAYATNPGLLKKLFSFQKKPSYSFQWRRFGQISWRTWDMSLFVHCCWHSIIAINTHLYKITSWNTWNETGIQQDKGTKNPSPFHERHYRSNQAPPHPDNQASKWNFVFLYCTSRTTLRTMLIVPLVWDNWHSKYIWKLNRKT